MSAVVSAVVSAASVMVSIKLLSGDLLSLEVPHYMTRQAFYGHVYQALPDDVAPEEDYMITLARVGDEDEDKEEPEELPADGEILNAQEGEQFWLFADVRSYEVELSGAWWETYDMSRPMNQLFRHWHYTVTQVENGDNRVIKNESFYHNEDEMAWFVQDRLHSVMCGRKMDEESIHIPEDETAYLSIDRVVEVMVDRLPGLTQRAKTHIKAQLTWQWDDMNTPLEWNEEQEEEQGAYPYHDDLPQQPLGVQRDCA